jgi:hypothetical protein
VARTTPSLLESRGVADPLTAACLVGEVPELT